MKDSLRLYENIQNLRNKEDSENEVIDLDFFLRSEKFRLSIASQFLQITSLRKSVADREKKIEDLNTLLTSFYSERKEMEETCEAYKKVMEDKKMEVAMLNDE